MAKFLIFTEVIYSGSDGKDSLEQPEIHEGESAHDVLTDYFQQMGLIESSSNEDEDEEIERSDIEITGDENHASVSLNDVDSYSNEGTINCVRFDEETVLGILRQKLDQKDLDFFASTILWNSRDFGLDLG